MRAAEAVRWRHRSPAIVNNDAFERTQGLVGEHGLVVDGAAFTPQPFGSWWVEASSEPARHIVWNGKERWLIVQQKTDRVFNGRPVWKNLWIARNPEDQTPDQAVSQLIPGWLSTP